MLNKVPNGMVVVKVGYGVPKRRQFQAVPVGLNKRGVCVDPSFVFANFFYQFIKPGKKSADFREPSSGRSQAATCIGLESEKFLLDRSKPLVWVDIEVNAQEVPKFVQITFLRCRRRGLPLVRLLVGYCVGVHRCR